MILTAEEIKVLEAYRLSTVPTNSPLSIRVDHLLEEGALIHYLEKVRKKLGAANNVVAASMLIKRYSFLIVMSLYAMSVWNKRLVLSPERIWLETDDHDDKWLPTFRFEELHAEICTGSREQWREETVRQLFAEHLFPLIEKLRKTVKISGHILWENISIYIYWVYEKLRNDEILAHVHEQLCDDFHYLVHGADGSLFGTLQQNPLKRFWKGNDGPRQRSTCCLHYQTGKGSHCRTCPRIAHQRCQAIS
ncbi:IucA/IucC family C-terminal-domain containing protein [Parageobacillus thermoglucosidasius]|uniref:IucA/IucC family C-terminal-domain containing protein n=1 Tax=Parageobacillus thermoglucosidasius TaxID=1426 RepID=UPI003B684D5C